MGKNDKYADKKKKEPKPEAAPVVPAAASTSQVVRPVSAPKVISKSGTKGRNLLVEVNYMPMKTDKLVKETFHYDCTFDPPGPRKFITQALEMFRLKNSPKVVFAFDGKKNVYTNRKLQHEVYEESVEVTTENGKMKPYKIKFQFANTVDMSVLRDYLNPANADKIEQALQCLEIVLKLRFKGTNAVPFGKQFYFPETKISLSPTMELWRGLFQSTVMGTKSLYVNTDVLNKAVASECELLDVLRPDNSGTIKEWQGKQAVEHLKMLKIVYQIKGNGNFKPVVKHFYRFGKSAMDQRITIDGRTMSVQEYFKSKYNINLRFPKLPLIQVLPAKDNIFYPAEFCRIVGGQLNQKKFESREMIMETATSTDVRKQKILQYASDYKPNEDMRAFGVEIGIQFERVMSRIINQPTIVYKGGATTTVKKTDGTWAEGQLVSVNPNPFKFAIINCEPISVQIMLELKNKLVFAATARGMRMDGGPGAENISLFSSRGNIEQFIRSEIERYSNAECKLIIVIVSENKQVNDNYSIAKRIAETEVGILTQCLQPRCFYDKRQNQIKLGSQTLGNIFYKINTKLNGINNHANDPAHETLVKDQVMFVGADVTHPPPDQSEMQASVAAVCASFDARGSKYHPVWRLQKGGIDRIDAFEDIMVEQLEYYKAYNKNALPSKILYYRDGVAESQFKTFLQPEIDSMKRACQRLYPQNMPPKITVIVVNKRHHLRAFPINKQDGDGSKFNNVLPGTVIDQDVVSPNFMQFFLASHAAIQGTSRPTKYTVILNECEIQADDMEALTYCLCHMYARCARSVSYPNCTYYAHWMADRAKKYIAGDQLDLENLDKEFEKRALKTAVSSRYPMFFV